MEQKNYHYDAFISYRHTELDKFVAETLHKQLEVYRMPKSTLKGRVGQKNRIERIFRDKDELPLTSNLEDPIFQALHNSEWLIVICSPRLRESLWCKKEIETFVALRGRERVLAVLVDGEPAESFPDELLFEIREEAGPDGTVQKVKVPVEPLAADVRGKNKKEILKNMKTEMLRILAAMFAVPYDDLRQRHRERRMRRVLTASLIGGLAGLVFGGYCAVTALRISNQNKQIEAQSLEIANQNEKLAANQALNLAESANRYLAEGNRESAVEEAYAALTEVDGITMPYTAQAHYALAESLGVYRNGSVYEADWQYETVGIIKDIIISLDGSMIGILDDTGYFTVLDMNDRKVLLQLSSDEAQISGDTGCVFLPDNKLVYIDNNFQASVYNFQSGQVEETLPTKQAFNCYIDASGNYLLLETVFSSIYDVYDGHTLKKIGVTPSIENVGNLDVLFLHEDGIMAGMSSGQNNVGDTLFFIDMNAMEVISSYQMFGQSIQDATLDGTKAYVVSDDIGETDYSRKTNVLSIDIASGELIWQKAQVGSYGEKLTLPNGPNSKEMLLITSTTMSLIDMENGKMLSTSTPESEIVRVFALQSDNGFYVFCEDGSWIGMNPQISYAVNYSYLFDCKSTNVQAIEICKGAIVVLNSNDNRITFYTAQKGPDLMESTHTVPEREEQLVEGDEVAELARSYSMENPDFVKSGLYSDDGQYFFVNYWDRDLVIYDTHSEKIVTIYEEFATVNCYLGKDHNGYTYITAPGHGYVLNQNMEFILHIPDLVDVDPENDKVYVQSENVLYEVPLYTAEELVKLAGNM